MTVRLWGCPQLAMTRCGRRLRAFSRRLTAGPLPRLSRWTYLKYRLKLRRQPRVKVKYWKVSFSPPLLPTAPPQDGQFLTDGGTNLPRGGAEARVSMFVALYNPELRTRKHKFSVINRIR